MFKKLRITCDEATTICDKSQYKEASFFEKIQLSWHLLKCSVCKVYTNQNKKMSSLFKMQSTHCKEQTNCLSIADKEALKKSLKNSKL